MRLSPTTLERVPAHIDRFSYDRAALSAGIVHFGTGAFHRAHQALYTDFAIDAGETEWGICGVSLRSRAVADQLGPQEGLYTFTSRTGPQSSIRVIGSIREMLVGGMDSSAIIDRIASERCHIVSFTVTEKGYARTESGGLNMQLASKSFYPLLAEALSRRKAAGYPGITLLSCDNLADNGHTLEKLLGEWITAFEPDLMDWFSDKCTCPVTMVDRIVPATTESDRLWLEDRLGVRDEAAVLGESFGQWVIEDRFAGPRPRWDLSGAQFVRDVAPFQAAKLRMLNGAHSALAYLGLERGYEYVHQAIADPELGTLIDRLMQVEAASTISAPAGLDLSAYSIALRTRFANSALKHRLTQIAADGSQKIPQRWLGTLAQRQLTGLHSPAIMEALGAWIRHLTTGLDLDDPIKAQLLSVLESDDVNERLRALFGPSGLLPSAWQPDEEAARLFKHR